MLSLTLLLGIIKLNIDVTSYMFKLSVELYIPFVENANGIDRIWMML